MAVNGGPPIIQMHVDNSVPLWAFFDMYGTTDRIRIAGSIKPNSVQLQQQQQQQSCKFCYIHQTKKKYIIY